MPRQRAPPMAVYRFRLAQADVEALRRIKVHGRHKTDADALRFALHQADPGADPPTPTPSLPVQQEAATVPAPARPQLKPCPGPCGRRWPVDLDPIPPHNRLDGAGRCIA